MTTELTVCLVDRPGSLAAASDVLGRAGVTIDGACGLVRDGRGELHILVSDTTQAERALIDSGFEICSTRQVTVVNVANQPGSAAAVLRRIADAGVNVDLLYATMDGRIVLASEDPRALQDALTRA